MSTPKGRVRLSRERDKQYRLWGWIQISIVFQGSLWMLSKPQFMQYTRGLKEIFCRLPNSKLGCNYKTIIRILLINLFLKTERFYMNINIAVCSNPCTYCAWRRHALWTCVCICRLWAASGQFVSRAHSYDSLFKFEMSYKGMILN